MIQNHNNSRSEAHALLFGMSQSDDVGSRQPGNIHCPEQPEPFAKLVKNTLSDGLRLRMVGKPYEWTSVVPQEDVMVCIRKLRQEEPTDEIHALEPMQEENGSRERAEQASLNFNYLAEVLENHGYDSPFQVVMECISEDSYRPFVNTAATWSTPMFPNLIAWIEVLDEHGQVCRLESLGLEEDAKNKVHLYLTMFVIQLLRKI